MDRKILIIVMGVSKEGIRKTILEGAGNSQEAFENLLRVFSWETREAVTRISELEAGEVFCIFIPSTLPCFCTNLGKLYFKYETTLADKSLLDGNWRLRVSIEIEKVARRFFKEEVSFVHLA